MTALTYDLSRALARDWRPGDEVVVSRLDHDANVRPWVQAAERVGATVRWIDFDLETAELRPDHLEAVLGERTRLVAVTAASNVLGTRPDVPALADRVHAAGALLFVDGVHHASHCAVDMRCAGRRLLRLLPLQVRRSPLRRAGRGAGAARGAAPGQAGAVDRRGAGTVRARHAPLRADGRHHGRGRLPGLARPTGATDPTGAAGGDVRRAGGARGGAADADREGAARPARRDALVAGPRAHLDPLLHDRGPRSPPTVHAALGERGVSISSGHCYAWEPCQALGLGADRSRPRRLAPYTDDDDVDRLLEALPPPIG